MSEPENVHIVNDGAQNEPAPAHVGARGAKFFKLPDFWISSPHAWFGIAESQFVLRGITSEHDRFGLVTGVLPEASARKITHLLIAPPPDCYSALKAALLSTHQLTEMQRMELLFNMEESGNKRPMDLLSQMMELVEPGEEKTKLFAMLFLRRLPPQVRVQLTEDDHTDLRALAAKADRVTAFLARQSASATMASASLQCPDDGPVDTTEFTVSAVARGGGRGGKFNGGRGGKNWRGGKRNLNQQQHQQQQQPGGDESSPLSLARVSSGLCYYHFNFGTKALSCKSPCAWQGN